MLRSRSLPDGLSGAAARLIGLVALACGLVLVTTVPIGLLTGTTLNRSISLGFYLLGAVLVVLGFMGGSRGPFRAAPEDQGHVRYGRALRRATLEELNDTISVAAIAVTIGLVLLVIGIAVDNRYAFF